MVLQTFVEHMFVFYVYSSPPLTAGVIFQVISTLIL